MEVYDDTDAVGEEKVGDEKYPALHICEFCNRKYSKKRNLRIHKNKKHPNQGSEGDIRCKYCPKQFNVFRMYRHVQAKHPNVPPETYENEPEHENNIPVDESRKFKCNFCPKTFTEKKYVRKHKLQVHPGKIEKGDVSCIYCGKIFNEGKMFIHV